MRAMPEVTNTARPALERAAADPCARISCQLAVTLTAMTSSQSFGSTWASGDERPEHAGIADQHVEPAVALVERQRQPVDAVEVLQVERHQRRRAAGGLDRVVELLQPADGARDRDHMGAGLRQRERERRADAARGAGDERDAVGEGLGIFTPFFACAAEADEPRFDGCQASAAGTRMIGTARHSGCRCG